MAKIPFTKLNRIKNLPVQKYSFGEYEIEVEQYLPLEDKVNLISTVIEQAGNGEEGFFNIVKLDAYYKIEMIRAYTNISFTEKQLEDTTKLFDAIVLNDIWAFVEDKIPQIEREYTWNNILSLAKEITNYNSSALGVLKTISNNRDNLNFDVKEIMNNLNDPQALTMLKDMMGYTGLIN